MFLAESIKIFKPEFFEGSSDILGLELFEDVLNLVHSSGVTSFFSHLLFQKPHEIWADGCIDKNISVEPSIVIPFEYFNVSHLWEVSERVDVIHE